jgi:hypothetical protein
MNTKPRKRDKKLDLKNSVIKAARELIENYKKKDGVLWADLKILESALMKLQELNGCSHK